MKYIYIWLLLCCLVHSTYAMEQKNSPPAKYEGEENEMPSWHDLADLAMHIIWKPLLVIPVSEFLPEQEDSEMSEVSDSEESDDIAIEFDQSKFSRLLEEKPKWMQRRYSTGYLNTKWLDYQYLAKDM